MHPCLLPCTISWAEDRHCLQQTACKAVTTDICVSPNLYSMNSPSSCCRCRTQHEPHLPALKSRMLAQPHTHGYTSKLQPVTNLHDCKYNCTCGLSRRSTSNCAVAARNHQRSAGLVTNHLPNTVPQFEADSVICWDQAGFIAGYAAHTGQHNTEHKRRRPTCWFQHFQPQHRMCLSNHTAATPLGTAAVHCIIASCLLLQPPPSTHQQCYLAVGWLACICRPRLQISTHSLLLPGPCSSAHVAEPACPQQHTTEQALRRTG